MNMTNGIWIENNSVSLHRRGNIWIVCASFSLSRSFSFFLSKYTYIGCLIALRQWSTLESSTDYLFELYTRFVTRHTLIDHLKMCTSIICWHFLYITCFCFVNVGSLTHFVCSVNWSNRMPVNETNITNDRRRRIYVNEMARLLNSNWLNRIISNRLFWIQNRSSTR